MITVNAMAAALVHVDFTSEINDWRSAVYGRQVRAAQIRALEKSQTQFNLAVDYIDQKGKDIAAVKTEAEKVLDRANTVNDDSEERIKLAEAWAHGHADYPARAKDNAKYWSEQSKSSASASAGSATASAGSAKLAESWAVGGTGTRDGENANNSKYWSEESERQYQNAKNEADRAAQYSEIIAPDFYLDLDTGKLGKKGGVGVDFELADGKLGWKILATA